MRRVAFWVAVCVALIAMIGGGSYAYDEYRATSGPGTVVKGYFAAVARADAPAALAFGDLPSGPSGLLTSQVLAAQQQVAPLHDVRILGSNTDGSHAAVRYSYRLRFADADELVSGSLPLVRRGARWRLVETAVATTLDLGQATDRVAFAGTAIPSGPILIFPGALPLRFDTPYLQVTPATSAVRFGGADTIDVKLEPTAAARSELTAALDKQLTACASGASATAACPLPPSVVPGSLAGRISSSIPKKIAFQVGSDAVGTISMTGTLTFSGRYRELDYDNVVHARAGQLSLPIVATAYPVAPLTVRFMDAT